MNTCFSREGFLDHVNIIVLLLQWRLRESHHRTGHSVRQRTSYCVRNLIDPGTLCHYECSTHSVTNRPLKCIATAVAPRDSKPVPLLPMEPGATLPSRTLPATTGPTPCLSTSTTFHPSLEPVTQKIWQTQAKVALFLQSNSGTFDQNARLCWYMPLSRIL